MQKAIQDFGKTSKPPAEPEMVPVQYLRPGDHFGLPSRYSNRAGVTWLAVDVTPLPDRLQVLVHGQSINSSKEFTRYYPMNKLMEVR
jgi:hypothetical protein